MLLPSFESRLSSLNFHSSRLLGHWPICDGSGSRECRRLSRTSFFYLRHSQSSDVRFSQLAPETKAVSSLLETKLSTKLDRFAYFFTRSASLSDILSVSSLPSPALIVGRNLSSIPDSLPRLLNTSGSSGSTVLIDRLSPAAHQNIAHLARLIVRGKLHALGRLPGSVARVLVHEESAGVVLDAVVQALKEAYGVDAALSGDYGRMRGEWDGEKKVRAEREKGEGKVVCGGAKGAKEEEGYFPPTIVEQPSL